MPDAGQRAPMRPALIELTLVRLKEFVREPEAMFWVFGFPLLLALGLGIAFRNRPPESIRVGVLQSAPASVASSLDSVRGLRAVRFADDSAGARALRNADVALVVAPGADGGVEYRFDPSRPDARTARLLADDAIQRGAGRQNPLLVNESTVSERGARYIDFFIPGLLGLNLMGSGIWSIAFAVVTARKQKLLKRLVATPMSRAQYLMSFLLSRLFFLVIEVGVLVGFGALAFDVPVRGSLVTLGVVCLVAALAFSAMGLLVASRARTVEAVSGLANLVMLPMWIFSGVFFSAANFPKALQPFIQALPLTGAVDALRAIMLRGASLTTVSGELLLLLGWLLVPFVVALRLFRWR
ncbi:MAG TPA: ABC transporter permease [Gemmatimonadales bacterium]|jgi:ABC transporter DrrB family efflux protein|nr:ABC transporter permease [Gemmatimonadales bacterium]